MATKAKSKAAAAKPEKKATTRKPTAPKARATGQPSARSQGKTVDAYEAALSGWQKDVVSSLRAITKAAAPDATESIKWGQPVYEINGPFAYVKAFASTVNFGFWRGAELTDPDGLLDGGGTRMRHVKLTSTGDVKAARFAAMVKEAVALNRQKGDPTRA